MKNDKFSLNFCLFKNLFVLLPKLHFNAHKKYGVAITLF